MIDWRELCAWFNAHEGFTIITFLVVGGALALYTGGAGDEKGGE